MNEEVTGSPSPEMHAHLTECLSCMNDSLAFRASVLTLTSSAAGGSAAAANST